MDHILASEILVVVLQKPGGLTFGEFRKLFCSTHGYPLDLSRYGYSSIQHLLDGMRDLVAVVEEAAQEPLITCISHAQHRHVFLGESELTSEEWLHSAQVLEDSTTGKQARIQEVSELLSSCLDAFPTGLKLRKMKEVMKKEHGTDLEALRKDLGCADVRHLLHLLPNIRLLNPSKPSNCVVQLQEGLRGTPASLRSSQSSIASGFQTPTEGRETDAGECGKDTSDEAASEYLQQPSIHHAGPTKPNSCAVHLQEGIQKILALANSALSGFPLGMKIRKLKDAVMKEHGIDLEEFSKGLGYKDLVDCLQQQPNIKLVAPAKFSNCIVQLQEDFKTPDGCRTPNRDIPDLVSSTQQSASSTPKAVPAASQLQSHSSPASQTPQNKVQIHQALKPSPGTSAPLNKQTNSKQKTQSPTEASKPAPAPKQSLNKLCLQKQEPSSKKTAASQLLRTKVLVPANLNCHQQEKPFTPQLSKLRTPTLSYSSVVSQNVRDAPTNRPTSKDAPMLFSTCATSTETSSHPSAMHHNQTGFPVLTSQSCYRSGDSQKVQQSGHQGEAHHPSALPEVPKNMEDLRKNILRVVELHPDGMSLFQFMNTYRTMFHHMLPLDGYSSAKQLLEEMKEVVKMEHTGIQHWVSPVASAVPPCQVTDEDFAGGYQNLPGGEEPSRNITAPTVASNQRTSKLQSDELHNQVSSQALLHNTPGSPSLHNDWDGLLDSRGPEQPPGHPIVLTKNTNSQLDSSTPNGPSEQIPGRKPPSTQPSQQKQETHVIKNAPEQSSEIATPKANSRMQQLWHLPAHIAKPQKAAILYSDIVSRSTQVAPSRISTSTNLPASSSCSSQSSGMSLQASSTVHYSTTQLPIPTSARQHTAAETQRGFGSSSETGEELSETSKQGPKSIEELKRNILHVLVQHPNGMTLFQFQNTYSFTFQHRIPLQGHQNMKQLLATMPDAVKTRGLGAQMLVFPYGSQVPPTSVILEENGFKLLETETEPHPTEHGAVLSNINLSAKTPPALNPSLTALKEEDTGAVPSCSSKPPAACMRTSHALDPEAAIFSLPSPVCSPQLPSVVHNGVSASFSEDITGYDYHVPEGSHVPALSQKLISDSSTPSDADSVDISTSPPVFATDSFMNPSSLADLKEPAVSPPCQNGWASSEHLPPNGIRNPHARNCSHAAQFEDNALPTSSQNLLAPGRETEMGTDPGASKTTPQESATIALRRSKTKAPVQFVVSFPDSFNKEDLNREMFIYGYSGEKPTFGTVDFPKL